jgi:exosome complex RNA-binding protein Csl4
MKVRLPGDGTHYLEIGGSPVYRRRFPRVGSMVRGRVEQIGVGSLSVKICEVDGVRSPEYLGTIQKEDMCLAFKDEMSISDLFMPGDMVRAKVTSLGNNGPIALSTVGEGEGRCSN